MEPHHAGYFPSEGDVVILKAEQKYDNDDEPFSSLTADTDNNNQVKKFVQSDI